MKQGAGSLPVLSLRGVGKQFGDTWAARDVSLDAFDGEFVFLIGPSGCGKTTVLRMIGGYETPSAGDIVVRGQRVNDVPLDKRNIGMVFQSYALFPHMTVRENIEYGLRMRNVPKPARRERSGAVMELVDLSAYGDRYPAQLSGGQRQRVALARVIVLEPDIMLLDEPLANLDRRMRDVMRVELRKLQEKIGITTLYVTHDQEEALTMADRIVVMQEGRVLQVGTPPEVYNSPGNPFVSRFLGETSHFEGVVAQSLDGGGLKVDIGSGVAICLRDNAGAHRPGERVGVSIRPERVTVSAQPDPSAPNQWRGTVSFVSYYGSHVVYLVDVDGTPHQLRASEAIPDGVARFVVGDEVHASCRVEHPTCVAL